MSKDHYVAQTYLSHFQIENSNGFINAIRKKDLKLLPSIPIKSICYKTDWSSSPYHPEEPRVIEKYLEIFEPKWNECVEFLEKEEFDFSIKSVMAGYIAFLRGCTPTATRLGQAHLAQLLKEIHSVRQKFDLNYTKACEEIRKIGGAKIKVDENFPKAMAIKSIEDIREKFVSFPWLILFNKNSELFLTSDNPMCMLYYDHLIPDFFIPITPKIGLLIRPIDTRKEKGPPDSFTYIESQGVKEFNRLLVKSAEDLIIFQKEESWIPKFVSKYKNWRVECKMAKLPGEYIVSQQRPSIKSDDSVILH